MEKILIIGAKGMLGQELVKIFKRDKDREVFAWDKEELDITNQKEVNKKITELKPQIIINSAAYNAVDEAESKAGFVMAKKINGLAPGYLAKVAKKIGAIFVHYSTDYVFNGELEISEPTRLDSRKRFVDARRASCAHQCGQCSLHQDFVLQIGFKEEDKPSPISNYGQSKLLGEKEVSKNTKDFYIVRLSKLFGKPAQSEGAKKSFFDTMLELGKKNKTIKAVDEETACFTYAPDLAKKTKEIIDSNKPFGIYHVVNSGPCTWYEAVVELYHQAKIKTKIIPVGADKFPRPAKRPYYSVLLNTKLNPMRDWKEALLEYLREIKK